MLLVGWEIAPASAFCVMAPLLWKHTAFKSIQNYTQYEIFAGTYAAATAVLVIKEAY